VHIRKLKKLSFTARFSSESGLTANVSREMARFHRSRDIRARFGRTRSQHGQHYGRWCFSEAAVADAFRKQFGGVGLKIKP
jgi:hypothetical protein